MSWVGGAVLGAATALLLNGAFSVVVFHGGMLGGPYWTYIGNPILPFLLTVLPLFAHLVGGFVSGRTAPCLPGLSGASSAVLSAVVAIISFLWTVLPFIWNTSLTTAIHSESFRITFVIAALFVVYFPFTVLSGYLGGRFGGRLRSSTSL